MTASAPSINRGQYSTGIDPRRFISEAVDGFTPINRPTAVGPPNVSKSLCTVVMVLIYRNSVGPVNRISVHCLG